MALQMVQVSTEPRLSTATHKAETALDNRVSRAVVPQSQSVSATTFPTVLFLSIAQGRLRKNIRYPSCSQRQNCCHLKRKIHQLGLFVSQVRKKRAIDARVSVNLKTCYSGCMSTVARPSQRTLSKKNSCEQN